MIWDDQLERDANLEPNNSPSTAAEIEIGARIDQALTSAEDDYDYYRFEVKEGQTYTLDLARPNAMYRGLSQIVAGQKYPYLKDEYIGEGSTHEEFTARATGSVVLVLHGAASYVFAIVPPDTTHDPVTYEPNNSVSSAAPVELSTVVTSELGAIPSDNADYFTFAVKANTTYILHLERANPMYRGATLVTSARPLLAYGYIASGSTDELFTTLGADDLVSVRLQGTSTYKLSIAPQ